MAETAEGRVLVCPRDDETLVPVRMRTGPGVTVDVCEVCRGFFLDAGELTTMSGRRDVERQALVGDQGPSLACPLCAGTMHEAMVDDVLVDGCGSCGGIWLDGGELARLQEKAPAEATGLLAVVASLGRLSAGTAKRSGGR